MKKFCTLNTVFLTAGIIVVSLGLAACSDDDPTPVYDLTFTGTGYNPHTNQTIRVAVFSNPGGAEVARSSAVVPADGTFSFAFPGVLVQGTAYNLDYFADSDAGAGSGIDGNGVCDAPAVDHAWRVAIPAVAGNVTQAEIHNTTFTNVCASFP